VNPYRGCEHGCIYCYARPYHEYLGFSSGLDFESRILVKAEAPALLRRALLDLRWQPEPINLCGVTDPYQPVEKTLRLTRGCLEVLAEFRNPVSVVTKNRLVVRDADLLGDLARRGAAVACVSVTTLDPQVTATLEPRATRPAGRLEAIRALADAGVPVGVLVSPVIPGLTDHEIPSILDAAAAAGARHAAYTVLRLPHAVKDLFSAWLERHHPDRASKVLNRLRAMRGGELDDPRFGLRMRGEGTWAEQIAAFFASARRRAGLDGEWPDLETRHFRRPATGQLRLFE